MSAPELTIDVDTATILEWDAPIGEPNDRPLPPVAIFLADNHLAGALQGHIAVLPNETLLTVTRTGYATVTTFDGHKGIYELFPARFNDDRPHEPKVYVGRWPD